jgi:membrane-associated protease RseP (regulator of RpoE activity)
MRRLVSHIFAFAIAALGATAFAQAPATGTPDPAAILAKAKAASGGANWDRFATQHSKVRVFTAGRDAVVERWVDVRGGRSYLTYQAGDVSGEQGYDGSRSWVREGGGSARAEISSVGRELAVNAAYRDRLAFWFPDRAPAKIEYKERASLGVTGYDVIRITPEGGRPFDFWVNRDTGLIDRLVESEAVLTRTETYSDFREVQGVKVPMRVRASRTDDSRTDEIITVALIEYDVPLAGIDFAPAGLAAADYRFPAGRKSVTVPIEVHNGHIYVRAKLDGKGPFLLLFVPGGFNVAIPDVARALGLTPDTPVGGIGPAFVTVGALDLGGLVVNDARFVVSAPQSGAVRTEGVAMDGMTGLDLLKRFPARIDFASSTLTLYDPDGFRYTGPATAMPLELFGAMPVVPARIAGTEGPFALDLSSPTSVTLAEPFWHANALDGKLRAGPEITVDPALGPMKARATRAPTLEIAGTTLREPVTLLAMATTGLYGQEGLAGTLGYGVLRRFSIVFDVPRGKLYLEPNGAVGEPDAFDRAGVVLDVADKGIAVVEVVPGGPADTAGIKTGDVIASLDGKPTATMPLVNARQILKGSPGTKVRTKLASGREVTITLRELL